MPLFYTRTSDGLPRRPAQGHEAFHINGLSHLQYRPDVQECIKKCYTPSTQRYEYLTQDHLKSSVDLSHGAAN